MIPDDLGSRMTRVTRSASDADDVAAFLRAGTRRAHEALEAKPILRAMREAGTPLPAWLLGYRTIALGYRQVETALHRGAYCGVPECGWGTCQVADAFGRDLAMLDAAGLLAPVEPPPPPPIESRSEAAGALWCLLGSRHGAAVLLATARNSFGAKATRFVQALDVQRSALVAERKALPARTSHHAFRDVERDRALAGALAVFAHFGAIADMMEGTENGREVT